MICLVEGRVRRAELTARSERGRDAVCSLLTWSEGSFEFSPGPLRVADDVEMTTPALLIEAARRLDARPPS